MGAVIASQRKAFSPQGTRRFSRLFSAKQIQSSNCLNLPHESNLLKIENSIGLESEY